jgi:glutaredoxin 1
MSKYIIYGTANCSFCVRAKELCERTGVAYEYKELRSKEDLAEMQEKIGVSTRTVPQIIRMDDGFGEHIGGYTELSRLLS